MRRIAASASALALGLLCVVPAWAAVSREQAVALAERQVPGQLLAVERGLHIDNSVVWLVKLATPRGEIRTVVIDAETGRPR